MSDQQTQPSDWLADDGLWYPAHLHPDYVAPPAPAPRPPEPAPPSGRRTAWIVAATIVSLLIVGAVVFAVAGSGGGDVKTGSLAEFCADWGTVAALDVPASEASAEDTVLMLDSLADVRDPESIEGDAAKMLAVTKKMGAAIEGVGVENAGGDFDQSQFMESQSEEDRAAVQNVGSYAESFCDE